MAEQRERRRLAEVLHDGLQQLLVAARVRAHMLGRSSDQGVQRGSHELVALLEEALTEARTLTGELSPPTLQKGGLLPTLEWLSRWMGEKHHLTVCVKPPAASLPVLGEDVSILLYQAVRELLLNTVKYAQVSAAEVTLTVADEELTLHGGRYRRRVRPRPTPRLGRDRGRLRPPRHPRAAGTARRPPGDREPPRPG